MSESKWTPGEWRVIPGTSSPTLVVAGDYADQGEPDLIVEVTSEDEIADAHLIAAAPELFEALDALMPILRLSKYRVADAVPAEVAAAYETLMDAAENALAKARGEAT